jgi:hypothetical protein
VENLSDTSTDFQLDAQHDVVRESIGDPECQIRLGEREFWLGGIERRVP